MAIPVLLDSDPDEVKRALSAAHDAWTRQSLPEALSWIQRAAREAAQRCEDHRATALFFAAAELAEHLSHGGRAGSGVQRSARAPEAADEQSPARARGPAGVPPSEDGKRTSQTPRTKLRNAMMAIDPRYGKRVDYDALSPNHVPKHLRGVPPSDPSTPPMPSDAGIRSSEAEQSAPELEPMPPAPTGEELERAAANAPLRAYSVNLIPIREDGDIRVLFVPPGTVAPKGVATALLVPTSSRDAALLRHIYDNCDAKL